MRKNERPRWAISFILALLFAVLLGAFPVSDVLADADIDVPVTLGQGVGDCSDVNADDPGQDKEDKVVFRAAEARIESRKTSWNCGPADHSRPFFAGRHHALPQKNAPPGFRI